MKCQLCADEAVLCINETGACASHAVDVVAWELQVQSKQGPFASPEPLDPDVARACAQRLLDDLARKRDWP